MWQPAGRCTTGGHRTGFIGRIGTAPLQTHHKAGLRSIGWASGACVGDYNNDGFDDIFCTYFGQNILYRNNGDGTFTDVTKAAGLREADTGGGGAGCTFLDFDRDGHLDLFVSNYVRFLPSNMLSTLGEKQQLSMEGHTGRTRPSRAGHRKALVVSFNGMGVSLTLPKKQG